MGLRLVSERRATWFSPADVGDMLAADRLRCAGVPSRVRSSAFTFTHHRVTSGARHAKKVTKRLLLSTVNKHDS